MPFDQPEDLTAEERTELLNHAADLSDFDYETGSRQEISRQLGLTGSALDRHRKAILTQRKKAAAEQEQAVPPHVLSLIERAALIAELAGLDDVEYAQRRQAAAKTMGCIPLSVLDAEVRKVRKFTSPPAKSDIGLITEGAVAAAFVDKYGQDLRFDHQACSWFVWDGVRWNREKKRLAFRWAHDLARQLAGETLDEKAVIAAGKSAFASGVERLAQADPRVAVLQDHWDTNRWLIGTPDGTLDLRTGEVRPALRDDYITRLLGTAPAPPGTPHPIWTRFLNEATQSDGPFQTVLQRLSGYALTGEIFEEILVFLYGEGGTGKGTFMHTLLLIFGEYAVGVPIEVFTANTKINLEYYRAQMAGARLVTASETEQGKSWAEAQLKEMSGNEAPLSARHPYGKPFNFLPQFLIMLVGNHAPKLKGRSRAMERRLRILPFKHLPETVNRDLKKNLATELPAILRWMVDGCLDWQTKGLGEAEAVNQETEAYFIKQDTFSDWLDERCVFGALLHEKPSRLLNNYNAWARANAQDEMNSNDFAELLDRTPGTSRTKVQGVRRIKGISLRPYAPEDEEPPYGVDR